MTLVRRSNRINASTNRRSPRLSRCTVYGSHYSYCSIPTRTSKKNNNRSSRALNLKDRPKKNEKSMSQIRPHEVVLKMLRSRPIIKKEYYQLSKKTAERRGVDVKCASTLFKNVNNVDFPSLVAETKPQQEQGFLTPQTRKNKAKKHPPQIRRSNRKTYFKTNDYLGRKYIDFVLYQ